MVFKGLQSKAETIHLKIIDHLIHIRTSYLLRTMFCMEDGSTMGLPVRSMDWMLLRQAKKMTECVQNWGSYQAETKGKLCTLCLL